MAEPFTPITKPLEEMTKAELFEIAQERQIPGRYDMHKDQLLKAVEEALTAPETEPAPAPGGEEGVDGDEDDGEIGELDPEDQDALNEQPEEGDGKGVEPPTNPDNPKPSAPPAADDAAAHLAKVAEQQAREKVAADRAAAHANGQLTEEDRVAILRAPKGDLKEMVDDHQGPVEHAVRYAQHVRDDTSDRQHRVAARARPCARASAGLRVGRSEGRGDQGRSTWQPSEHR